VGNVLFQASDEIQQWSDECVYLNLGYPETEGVTLTDPTSSDNSFPTQVVAPIDVVQSGAPKLLREDIVPTDYGQSFEIVSPPDDFCFVSSEADVCFGA
jgi:hypothetical protein